MRERFLYKALGLSAVYRLLGRVLNKNDRGTFPREHIRAREGQRVLDIGCGPADVVAELPRVDYTGFDSNPEYIATATKNYGDRGRFYCKSVNEESLSEHENFDIVLAIGVLHHLDDAEAEKLFRLAHAALVPGGRLVTLDGCYVPGQSRIARFLISRDRGRFARNEAGYRNLASRVFREIGTVIRHDLINVPYTHLVMECVK